MWNDSPHLSSPPQTEDIPTILNYVKNLANTVAKMAKDLEFILNGNVAFDNIRTNGIEAKNIKAGAIIAEKIDVNELSAISANLGHIIAGLIESVEIYGSYISTRKDAYPRAELSNVGDLFAAYLDAKNHIKVEANYQGSPALNFVQDGNIKGRFQTLRGSLGIDSVGPLDLVASGGDVYLTPSRGYYVLIPSFGMVKSLTGQNLGVELDSKARMDQSGYNLKFDEVTRNLKMFTVEGNLLAQVNIPK